MIRLARIFNTDRDEEAAKPDEGCMSIYCPRKTSSSTQHPSGFPAFTVDRYEISGLDEKESQHNHDVEIQGIEKLKEFHQDQEKLLYGWHKSGGSGQEIARYRSETIDHIVKNIFNFLAYSEKKLIQGLCLLACGGYGRNEMNPYSDVDIMFLYDERELVQEGEEIIRSILRILWDFGFKVGHSTRSLSEALEDANKDFISKTAMMESRLLAGEKKIFHRFKKKFRKNCILGRDKEYIRWRLENISKLRKKFGKSVFMQEPNIKLGSGGLRDYQNLLWISHYYHEEPSLYYLTKKKFVSENEKQVLEQNYDFLLRVRNSMHYQEKRAQDCLTLRLQGKVATELGYPQRNMIRRSEAFMKNYYESTRDIYLITSSALARMNSLDKRKAILGFTLPWNKREDNQRYDRFIIKEKYLYPVDSEIFYEPERIIKAYDIAQIKELQFSSELSDLLKKNLYKINDHFRKSLEIRNIFLTILSRKGHVGGILRLMHDHGFLGKYIPEFGALTCLVQHEFYHLYTADEHTLVCLEKIDSLHLATNKKFLRYSNLLKNLDDPTILYLGMLLHDTGKAANVSDHAKASRNMAKKVAFRWKLPQNLSNKLLVLVELHGELGKVARTRDLDEQTTIIDFANKIKDNSTLDTLMILTLADGMGTSDSQWSDWKEQLVWKLYDQTKSYLEAGKTFFEKNQCDRGIVKALVAKMLPEDFNQELEAHFEQMPERYFKMMDPSSIKEHLELLRSFFEHQIKSSGDKEHLFGSEIFWKENLALGYTEVSICGWDREKLLERIAASFLKAGINILSADIFTRRDHVTLDIFRVTSVRTMDPFLTPKEKKIMEKSLQELLQMDGNKLARIFHTDLLRKPGSQMDAALSSKSSSASMDSYSRRQTSSLALPHQPSQPPHNDQYEISGLDLKKIVDYQENGMAVSSHLSIDNQSHSNYTIIEVEAPDRDGLFYDLVRALHAHNISIDSARIATEMRAAFDTFYILDSNRKKVTDEAVLTALRDRLTSLFPLEESLHNITKFNL